MTDLAKSLENCLKYEPIPLKEEKEMIREYKRTGNPKIRETITNHNLRLVYHLAGQVSRTWKTPQLFEDLFQHGTIYLIQALRPYNPDKGTRFGNYAFPLIKGRMQRYILRNKKTITFKRNTLSRAIKDGFEKRNISLEDQLDPHNPNSDTWLSKIASSQESAEEILLKIERQQVAQNLIEEYILTELSPSRNQATKELTVLTLRLIVEEPATLQYIGNYLGISRERVRQIETKILTKLKKISKKHPKPTLI